MKKSHPLILPFFAYIRIIQNRVFFKDGMTINFLKNDTLKKLEIKTDMLNLESEMEKITVITPDPSNENLCNFTVYEPVENDTALQSLTKQNIISEYQATITNTEKGFIVSFSNSEEKWFYTLASEPTTSIHRKIRPAIIPEKSKNLTSSVARQERTYYKSGPIKFHVKRAIASVVTGCLHIGMIEHEHVGSEGAQHYCLKNIVRPFFFYCRRC
jgi:hypothetical protein